MGLFLYGPRRILRIIIYVVVFHCMQAESSRQSCSADDYPYQFFGTSTSYSLSKSTGDIPDVPGCKAQQLWMLARPSISWPMEPNFRNLKNLQKLSADIVANHEKGRGELVSSVVESIKNSNFPPKEAKAGVMVEQGEKHFQELAKSLKTRFPELLNKPYSKDDFEIRYADSISSEQSVKSFTKGLFGEEFDTSQIQKPPEVDKLLNAPNICASWKGEIYEKGLRRALSKAFHTLSSLRREVSQRLGFKSTLDKQPIIDMYLACSLQKAMKPEADAPWCAVFSSYDLMFIEYLEDQFYWKVATGGVNTYLTDITRHMPCLLYQDILHKFQPSENGKSPPPSVFYFADEKTMLLLIRGLGFLTGTNVGYVDTMNKRTFRTSNWVPFGANLLVVLYKCASQEELQVGYYINGMMIKDILHSDGLRPWKRIAIHLESAFMKGMACSEDFCPEVNKETEDTTAAIFRN